jgi:mannose-6-phosphate isomerase-like protein (cupin superfamily)
MIREIKCRNETLAIIIDHSFSKEGISFFTTDESSQQLAFMKHKKGKVIKPHIHIPVKREIEYTKEVIIIRRGRLRVDFYDNEQNYLESCFMEAGDVILLSSGGHGFVAMDDLEFFEVKQGPYLGENDKIRFDGVKDSELILKQ